MTGVEKVEEIAPDCILCVATAERPIVQYPLRGPIRTGSIACMNIRSANLSSTDWNVKFLRFGGQNDEKPWGFDDSMKSASCLNIITASQIRLATGDHTIHRLGFTPAYQPGEYFTLGPVEVFTLE